jgi:adenosylcobinamide-GDP ribazoletransferase
MSGVRPRWIDVMIAGLAAALQFLTIAPPLVRRPFADAEMGRAVGWFPLVGLLIGGLLVLVDLGVRRLWPAGVSAALVLAVWVVVTGGLHLDGLMDSCDGLFGGRTIEDRLRILRDPRIGSFALIGGVLVMLTKWSVLAGMVDGAERLCGILLAPTLGRWTMALVLMLFPYVRPEGAGRTMKDHVRLGDVALAATIALAAVLGTALWTKNVVAVIAMLVASLIGIVVAWFAWRRIGGLTGDVFGAVCELAECSVLLAMSAREAIG